MGVIRHGTRWLVINDGRARLWWRQTGHIDGHMQHIILVVAKSRWWLQLRFPLSNNPLSMYIMMTISNSGIFQSSQHDFQWKMTNISSTRTQTHTIRSRWLQHKSSHIKMFIQIQGIGSPFPMIPFFPCIHPLLHGCTGIRSTRGVVIGLLKIVGR